MAACAMILCSYDLSGWLLTRGLLRGLRVFPMQARKMSTRLCHAVGLLFIVDGLLFQLDVLCAYLGHL